MIFGARKLTWLENHAALIIVFNVGRNSSDSDSEGRRREGS